MCTIRVFNICVLTITENPDENTSHDVVANDAASDTDTVIELDQSQEEENSNCLVMKKTEVQSNKKTLKILENRE